MDEVRIVGPPTVAVNAEARTEVSIPISPASEPWRSVFRDELPTRRHYRRIRAEQNVIRFAVDDVTDCDSYLAVIERARQSANQRLRRRVEDAGRLTASLRQSFIERSERS
jgi:hypothetical protein